MSKISRKDCITLNGFFTTIKEIICRENRQPKEPCFSSYLDARALIYRIYKGFQILKNRRTQNLFKSWATELNMQLAKQNIENVNLHMGEKKTSSAIMEVKAGSIIEILPHPS